MTLSERQQIFTRNVAKLIEYVFNAGYACTFGEAYRPQPMADLYAKQGKGIKLSLHTVRLAVDLNLFKNGKYLTDTADYEPIGVYWEALHPENAWGGRFKDGNHFSMEYEGRK